VKRIIAAESGYDRNPTAGAMCYRVEINPVQANKTTRLGKKRKMPMQSTQYKLVSYSCFILGFASIAGSIAIWFLTGGSSPETQAHAERFGIFVGLWAPTFFILSNRFSMYADKKP